MQQAPAEGCCRYCGTPVEQPQRGGRQKLFCSDEHRLRYWRERRRQGLPTREEGSERPADVRPLTWELQAILLGFQHTVQALAGALAEAGDLDAVRVLREQSEAEAQRRIAGAEERRAQAERGRLEAEAMAEAAAAAAQEAQERAERLQVDTERVRARSETAVMQAQAAARELASAQADLARERQARDRAEQQVHALSALAEERAAERDRLAELLRRIDGPDESTPRPPRSTARRGRIPAS